MTMMTILSILVLAVQIRNEPQWLASTRAVLLFIFIILYALEIFIKICAFGLKKWKRSRWNWWDLFVVTGGAGFEAFGLCAQYLN